MLTILPFGGCTVNNPLLNLQQRGLAKPVYKQVGFKRTPYALSPNAFLQLYKFCNGTLTIPSTIRKLMYVDADHVPSGNQLTETEKSDVMLIEISTPFDLIFDGFVLNNNRITEVILSVMPVDDPSVAKNVTRWKKALMTQKTEIQMRLCEELIPYIDIESPDGELIKRLLREAKCKHVDNADMEAVLDQLTSLIPIPVGLVLHNFCYMPDGRPVVWPADLNDILKNIATDRNIPVYDPRELVTKHGSEVALASDLRHWAPDFYPVIADAIYKFAEEVQRVAARQLLKAS